jgi:hypothetical protein
MEYIQLVISNNPGEGEGNPQNSVGRPEAFKTEAFAGCDLLGDLWIGIVKEEQVVTGEPNYLFD